MARGHEGKKERKKVSQVIRQHIADSFEVSKELTLDVVKVTLIGQRELTIENYTGVIEYTDKVVYLLANPAPLIIAGDSLEIKAMSKELLCVTGTINRICFEN